MSRAASRRPAASPLRYFVTGTDTGVGKSEVSCALLSLLADAGLRPAPFKPYESGCRTPREPLDALAMRVAAESDDPIERVCVHRFREPLAPGVAAARLGMKPDWRKTMAAFRSFKGRALVAEGAGGLFVPLDERRDIIDLIGALKLPVVLVARAGLGTLNHVALSLEALEARALPVRAVVLSRSRAERDPSERDNASWIQKRHGVEVLGPVPFIADAAARRRAFKRVLAALVPVDPRPRGER